MAEGEGTSFENQAFDPDSLNDDEEEPLIQKGDDPANETCSFITSTPVNGQYQTRVREEMEMRTMQQVGGGWDRYVLC